MFEEKLIEAVKKHPCIFDKGYVHFRNKEFKDASWKIIENEVGENEEKCRGRWKTLRERCVKEMAKLTLNENCKPWKFTSAMSFMKDFIDIKTDSKDLTPILLNTLLTQQINFEEFLINEVKKYKSIYDKEHPHYENKRLKEKNWSAISSAVAAQYEHVWSEFEPEIGEIDINELCHLRWQSLYKRYHEEYFNGKEKESDWMYTEALSFLKGHTDIDDDITTTDEIVPDIKSGQKSPSSSRKRTFEDILIKEVKKCPCIFDRDDANYRHREVRDETWVKIASAVSEVMGCTKEFELGGNEEKCRLRWKTLRERFVKEYIKMLQFGDEYKSSWKFMEDMSFMESYIDQNLGNIEPSNPPTKSNCLPKNKHGQIKIRTTDFEEILINEVKKYKCIYDRHHPDHRKKDAKEDIWIAISDAVKAADENAWKEIEADAEPEEICRLRWKTLRERYVREYLKTLKYGAEYTTTWKHFGTFSFMNDYIEHNFDNTEIVIKTPRIKPTPTSKENNYDNTTAVNFEETLIGEVKKYPCIYDQDNPNYRRRECIKAAWSAIVSAINENVRFAYAANHAEQEEKCRSRWKTLRERYVKEYTKMTHFDLQYTSNWKYIELMSFMQYCIDQSPYDENNTMDFSQSTVSPDINTTFSRNFEEILINEVKNHACIYDPDNFDYRRKETNKTAWATIASSVSDKLGFLFGDKEQQEEKCRIRWKTLREKYVKECKKISSSGGGKYKCYWKYYDAMSFMQGCLDQNPYAEDMSLMQDLMDRTLSDEEDIREFSPKTTSVQKMGFKQNFEEILIREVKKYRCLYDKYDDCFRNTKAKCAAWIEIASAIGVTDDQCRSRWLSLRTQLINELKSKIEDPKYNSNWEFYDVMAFMMKYVNSKGEQSKKDMYCRTCLKQIANDSGRISENYDIFETFNLCEKLSQCTSLTFEPEDDYPSSVCHKCYEKTLDFYQFRLMCLDSSVTFGKTLEYRCNLKLEYDSEDTMDDNDQSCTNSNQSNMENVDSEYELKSSTDLEKSNEYNLKSENEQFIYEDPLLEPTFVDKEIDSKVEKSSLQNFQTDEIDTQNFRILQEYSNISEDEMSVPDHSISKLVKENAPKPQKFKCSICSQEFSFRYRLTVHMRQHTVLDKTKCRKCLKRFPNPTALAKHHCLNKSQKRFVCDVEGCTLSFTAINLLEIHKKRHAGVKNYICPYCGVSKVSTSELNRHINCHTFAKKYNCPICSKPFKCSATRTRHVNGVHKKIKPYACRFCDSRFESSYNRDHHEMAHQGIKPYSCDICNKQFKWNMGLKMHHQIVHCGAKPHICEICGKEYKWLGSYTKHIRTHKPATEIENATETNDNWEIVEENIKHLIEEDDDADVIEFTIESCS